MFVVFLFPFAPPDELKHIYPLTVILSHLRLVVVILTGARKILSRITWLRNAIIKEASPQMVGENIELPLSRKRHTCGCGFPLAELRRERPRMRNPSEFRLSEPLAPEHYVNYVIQ